MRYGYEYLTLLFGDPPTILFPPLCRRSIQVLRTLSWQTDYPYNIDFERKYTKKKDIIQIRIILFRIIYEYDVKQQ